MSTGTLDIIHVDMDAFFAAVEQRDNPELRGKPVVVGGSPDGRGVVSTASYEARKFGIHSAMSAAEALARCPHAVFVHPEHGKYTDVSAQLREIFYEFTDLVEPLSVDEAFLDVSGKGGGIGLGGEIKRQIRERLSLTASVGVSYNKFLAKLGSDMNKPDGFTVITRSKAQQLLPQLPVRKLWGVGPKTEQTLHGLEVFKAGDLLKVDRGVLRRRLGSRTDELILLARGIDERKVEPPTGPKSIGEEVTFAEDIADRVVLRTSLDDFARRVIDRVERHDLRFRTVTIKIRYSDFRTITRSQSLQVPCDDYPLFRQTCHEVFDRVELRHPVRLLGVTVSNLEPAGSARQLHFGFLTKPEADMEDETSGARP